MESSVVVLGNSSMVILVNESIHMIRKLLARKAFAVCLTICVPLGAVGQSLDQTSADQPALRPTIGGPTTGLIEKKALIGPDSLVAPGSTQARPHVPLVTLASSNIDLNILGYDIYLKGLRGLKIYVRNRTDRALLFDSYKAFASLNGVDYSACSVDKLNQVISPPETIKKALVRDTVSTATATFLVGAVQTAQDALLYSGPVLKRYGPDQARREDEMEVFGQRILWPGDETSGVVYFSGTNLLQGASVTLPVQSFYDANDSALLVAGRKAQ
jgi:hypothetical protein